jgi:hypothetical protein
MRPEVATSRSELSSTAVLTTIIMFINNNVPFFFHPSLKGFLSKCRFQHVEKNPLYSAERSIKTPSNHEYLKTFHTSMYSGWFGGQFQVPHS